MFLQRTLVTIIFIPLILLLLFFGKEFLFCLAVSLISSIALFEFYKIVENIGSKPYIVFGIFSGIIINICAYLESLYIKEEVIHLSKGIFSILMIFLFFLFLFRKNENNNLVNISFTLLGISYISLPFSFLTKIRYLEEGSKFVFLLLVTIWAVDISAYLIGSNFGKHKLFPSISPNKTIEGSIAGWICGFLVCIFIGQHILKMEINIIASILIPIISQISDLIESLIKRTGKVKDSSKIIPGHGGVLDIIDSLIFTSPIFYFLIIL